MGLGFTLLPWDPRTVSAVNFTVSGLKGVARRLSLSSYSSDFQGGILQSLTFYSQISLSHVCSFLSFSLLLLTQFSSAQLNGA